MMSQNDKLFYVTQLCAPDDRTFDVPGAVGCLMVFEAYDAALNWADGKEYLVSELVKVPAQENIASESPTTRAQELTQAIDALTDRIRNHLPLLGLIAEDNSIPLRMESLQDIQTAVEKAERVAHP